MRRRSFLRGVVGAVAIGLAPALLNKTRLGLAADPLCDTSFGLFDRAWADIQKSRFDFNADTFAAVIYDSDSGHLIAWSDLGYPIMKTGTVDLGDPAWQDPASMNLSIRLGESNV